MKQIIKLFAIIILSVILFSCKKDDDTPAGCDINGIWMGDWESDTDESGTFLAQVNQSGNSFDGNVRIRLYSDDTQDYSSDFYGSVKNGKINVGLDISGVEISVDGDVINDNTVSGTFSVPTLSMNGTYEGEKIPSETVQITEIYKISTTGLEESIHDVMCINNRLWMIKYPSVYVNDVLMYPVVITDLEGNQVGSTHIPAVGINFSFDGEFIRSIYNGTTLFTFDTLGNEISETTMAFGAFNVAYHDNNFYFDEGLFRYIVTDDQLAIQDTMHTNYMCANNLTQYKDHFIFSSTNVLYELSITGKIIKAYTLPEDIFISKIVTNNNNNRIWCLYNSYDSAADEYIIYEIII